MRGVPRICGVLAFAVAACAFFAAPGYAGSGPSIPVPLLAAPPTIDGVQGAPEAWDNASTTQMQLAPGLVGTLYVGRDATNLYVAMKVTDPNGTTPSSALYFDNNDDGTRTTGDDLWDLTSGGVARDWFTVDPSLAVNEDALGTPPGTNDVTAKESFSNGVYFAEYQHPLCSADTAHDICVSIPAQLGIDVLYAADGQTGVDWPGSFVDAPSFANLSFVAAPPQPTINVSNGDGAEYLGLSGQNYTLYYNANQAGSFRLSVPANDGGHEIVSASFPTQLGNAPGWALSAPDALGETFSFPNGASQPDSIHVTSTDSNNQTSPSRLVAFQPDQSGPTGSYSCQPIACSNSTGPVRVTVHVSDGNGSGIHQIFYRTDGGSAIDGGTPIENGGSFLVSASSAQVVIAAVDNVGNQTASVASGGVSGKAPPANLTWNYASDFQDQSNPGPDLYGNPSVWSYGEVPVGTQHDPATATLYPQFNAGTQDCWHSATLEYGTPDDCVVSTTNGLQTDVDPASTRDTFITWKSPITGNVNITGGFADADAACGDGVNWFVDKNGGTIASGVFASGGSQTFPSSLNGVAVNAGDTITFLVGPGPAQDLFCDSTKADITITQLAPPPSSGPTNGRIVYDEALTAGTDVFSANPDGTHVRQLTSQAGNDEGAQYSPDGKHIVWGSQGGNASAPMHIWVMNSDGTGATQLTTGSTSDSSPTYSPDGSEIAFARATGGDSDIWVMHADGSNAHDITNTVENPESSPSWSPDGLQIAYARGPVGSEDVYVASADGSGTPVNLTDNPAIDNHDPSWSPDGTKIAYAANEDTNNGPTNWPQILVMDANGANQHTISDVSSSANFSADPSWSPDGTKIAFSFSPGGFDSFEIYTMNADGLGNAQVTSNSTYDGFPNWGTEPLDTGGGPANPPQTGPTYTVNTADDITDATGCTVANCSLHEAITAANAGGVPATIDFAILSGSQTIDMNQQLPTVTVPITIDGTSQPGEVAGPPITLDATGIEIVEGSTGDGLVLGRGHSIVRGLALGNFPGNGIVVEGGADSAITGNVIGATADGTGSRPNRENGIVVEGATGTQITGNVVSGSAGAGILVTGGSTGTRILGNKIGTDANGDAGNGNVGAGVEIDADSPSNQIGSKSVTDGNRIADNGGAAVLVASAGNPILGNSIEANAGGGIDLGTTGNQLQAAPLIAAAHTAGGTLTVIGKFLTPGGTYRLEYFLNTSCPDSSSIPREGATFIGTSQVTVNAGGEAAVNATLDISNVPQSAGNLLTATATSATDNTSQFSQCVTLTQGGTASSATLNLSTDTQTTQPGAAEIPLAAIPPSAFANTSVDSNGSTASAPLGAIPLGAIPLGAIPLGAIPLGAIPLGAIGFTPQTLLEDGLGGVPLNTIPLKAPLSWETELQGTPLAGLPIQTLTLRDVLTLAPPPSNLTTAGPGAIGLKDLDLSLSPLGAIPLGAIALGSSPLGAIPISGDASKSQAQNVADWCAQIQSLPGFASFDCSALASQTVMGVAIEGVPLGAIPLGAIPLGAIPLGAIPLGAIPLGAIDLADSPLGAIPLGAISLADTPLGAIPLGAIPLGAIPLGAIPLGAIPVLSAVVDCGGGFNCAAAGATLETAFAAGALKPGATLADLGAYGTATLGDLAAYLQAHPEIQLKDVVPGLPDTVTLRDLLAALMGGTPPSWESFPLDGLQNFAGAPGASGGEVTYTAGFSIQGTGNAAVATLGVTMPTGALYKPGSATLNGTPVADPLITGSGLSWTFDTLNYGDSYTLAFKLRPGFQLGAEHAVATLSTNGVADQSAQASVTVGDTFESNDTPAVAPAIAPSTLYVSYLGNGNDVDFSTLHIDPSSAPAGTRIKIFLSHLQSDDDLAVFGPVDPPLRSAPLGSIPLGAISVGDQSVQPGEQMQQLAPDTAQDLPFGALPPGDKLLGVSDNRGTADEEVDITSTGLTGDLLIQVSSYDGHPTTDPYVIRVEEDPPPALPPCTQTPPSGSVPSEATLPTNASIPATAQTLILFNEKRLGQYYTAADAHTVYTKLQAYAARSDVNGIIVPVEKDAGVAAAYANWDHVNTDGTTNLCSPAAANGVVRAIGTLLDSLQAGHPNLKSMVVVGADNVIPFARTLDTTQQANELGFRSTFGLVNNEYVGAVAGGYLLSDDPYADPDPQSVVGGSLYVPKLALGRLVETPADISRQLDAYTAANGLVNPQTKLVTGYDFLTDGAQAVDAALGRTSNPGNLISDTWTADDLRNALFPVGTAPLIDSLNAHYDQHRALSAQGNTLHNETAPYLFTTTDVASRGPNAVLGRIVFTMGCHAGFSLFDNLQYFTSGQPTDFALDWPQATMEGGAIEFMGNTGYGLGDTAAVAYSERLNQLFAQRLDGTMTIGEALEYAKQEYFGDLGVVSPYDVKVGNEATLYGIPTYRLGTATPAAAPAVQPTHTDGPTGLAGLDVTVNPTFTLHSPAGLGSYYSADDPNGIGIQDTNRRPIEPLTSLDVTEPGTTAHGVLVTSLASHDVNPFTVSFGRVTVDSSAIEPQLQGLVDFPASIQSLATIATPNGQRQRAVLLAGHFSSGSVSNVGKQRLYDSIGATVLYSTSADFVRPTIRDVQVLKVGSTTVGFEADVADLDASGATGTIKEAIVLYLDGSGVWQRANLTCANGRCSGGGPLTGTSVDYIAEAVDAAGNVGVNANKASATNVAGQGGSAHISISFGGAPVTAGWFTTAVTATLSSDDGATLSSSLDGGSFVTGTTVPVSGDGLHTLDVRGSDGSSATFAVPVDTSAPTIRLSRPLDGFTYLSGETADFSCSDAGSGIAANGCVGTFANGAVLPPTSGAQTFTVTARDNVGRTATVSVTYTVWQFSGFNPPVDNPPTLNVVNAGSAVPVKFSLGGNRGLTPFASGYPASQPVACASDAPTDPIETTVTAGSSGLQYDSGSNSYTYVWKTDKSWAGTCRDLILRLPSGSFRKALFKFK